MRPGLYEVRHQILLWLAFFMTPACLLAGSPALTPGTFHHRGYEQIIAGPDVPDLLGLPTTLDYTAFDVALSADGSRVWFVLFNPFHQAGDPEYEIWTMLAHGSGELRVAATDANWVDSSSGNLWVETSALGDVAVLSSSQRFSAVDLSDPIPSAELILDMDPYGEANDWFRLTNDGSTVVLVDHWNLRVGQLSVASPGVLSAPTIIADAGALSLDGIQPRQLKGFDLAGDSADWWTCGENFFGSPYDRSRKWLNHGAGVSSPPISHEALPLDELWAPEVEASDDGQTLVYCLDADATLNHPPKCWIQESGSPVFREVADGAHWLGKPTLADDGGVVYLLSDWAFETSYGFRADTTNPDRRRVGGSQRLSGRAVPSFSRVRMSDDGRVLAAPTSLGVYLQHDGLAPPTGFPALDSVAWAYDSDLDELVVQVATSQPSVDFERIYTLPLFRGVEPSRYLAEEENPLWFDADGGGVNWSTTFDDLGGGVWSRRIPLHGKFNLLTSEFGLRIVAVDSSGTRTTYSDFNPLALVFSDGFESGDLSAWAP